MTEHADWRAIGVGVRLVVDGGDLAAARAAAEALLDEVDRTYSRFRPDSELMALNAAAGRDVVVSPLLARAIGGALTAARWSGGAVDPTIGRALRVIGYDRDFEQLGGPVDITMTIQETPGWQAVRLDPARRVVRVPAGVELDLGSTGKGLAADLGAARALEASGARGVLLSLGGDLATAGTAPAGGWRILAAEDSGSDDEAGGETVAIDGGAVATSSTTVRRWRSTEGVTLHHIVDPWTGRPADAPWRTVTVVAADCETANAASTAAIVLGDRAESWLAETGLPARLVGRDGSVRRIGGWPEPLGPAAAISRADETAAAAGSAALPEP